MSDLTPDDWIDRVENIRVWRRGDQRAPHKPLLLLWAIGRLQRGEARVVSFEEAEAPLSRLLDEFGTNAKTSPSYPFVRLAGDKLWEVTSGDGVPLSVQDDSAGRLKEMHATGMLDEAFATALQADPELLSAVVHRILDAQFPLTIQADVLGQVGISLEGNAAMINFEQAGRRRRDPAFRDQVLLAYERSCAMCGFDSQMSADSPGLEAAHVRWFNFDGPDEVSNGLCLCSIHHKLLDRGVLGLSHERRVVVSQRFTGRSPAAAAMVLSLNGKKLSMPQAGYEPVAEPYIEWHSSQVFKEPARLPA